MQDKKLLGLVLIVVGVALLFFGFNASQSLGDQLTETLTGRFTEETMFMIVGGAVAVAAGAWLVLRKKPGGL